MTPQLPLALFVWVLPIGNVRHPETWPGPMYSAATAVR